MKHNIIKTDNYLLVVNDSEIKAGDYGLITSAVMSYDAMLKEWNQPLGSKIIAHLPLNNSPILEGVPLLPILDEGVFVTPTHFEFEMEKQFEYRKTTNNSIRGFTSLPYPTNEVKPRTTTNSQGQTQVVGRYIYE